MTPLYYAVNCEYPDIVEALVCLNRVRVTLLISRSADVVPTLSFCYRDQLEAGADINAADNDGDSPATLTTSDAIQRMISRHALERTVSINVRRPQD